MLFPAFDDLIGTPFVEGGRDPKTGIDCYGLLMVAYSRLGKTIPDYRSPALHSEMEALITTEKSRWVCHAANADDVSFEKCQPGRTLLLNILAGNQAYNSHVGFVHKPGWFLHAWEKTNGVTAERISLWKRRIVGVYEFNG